MEKDVKQARGDAIDKIADAAMGLAEGARRLTDRVEERMGARWDALSSKEERELEQAQFDLTHFQKLAKTGSDKKHWEGIAKEHEENVKRLKAKREGRVWA